MNFDTITEKEALNYAFGANVFPKEFISRFEVKSKSISDDEKAKDFISELKSEGFLVKKKSYSDFTAITAVKKRLIPLQLNN